MPIPLVKHGLVWKERERNKDGTWRRKRRTRHLCPGADGVKVVDAILERIKKKREAIQMILADEFNEPPTNFYDLADKIARECEHLSSASVVKSEEL